MRLALVSILALEEGERLPALTCWLALAFAFRAWFASGIGIFARQVARNLTSEGYYDACLLGQPLLAPDNLLLTTL